MHSFLLSHLTLSFYHMKSMVCVQCDNSSGMWVEFCWPFSAPVITSIIRNSYMISVHILHIWSVKRLESPTQQYMATLHLDESSYVIWHSLCSTGIIVWVYLSRSITKLTIVELYLSFAAEKSTVYKIICSTHTGNQEIIKRCKWSVTRSITNKWKQITIFLAFVI